MSIYFYAVLATVALISTGLKLGEPRGDVFLAASAVVLLLGIATDKIIEAIRGDR